MRCNGHPATQRLPGGRLFAGCPERTAVAFLFGCGSRLAQPALFLPVDFALT